MPTSVTYPQLLPKAFASNPASPTYGGKNTIPSGAASPLASLDDGFPLANMTPISGGGVPPEGKDMNGVLWLITQFQVWMNAGGRMKYDSAFSTAVGGYPTGAVLMLSDNVSEVICVTNSNTNDPNAGIGGATGWAPYSGSLAGAGFYQLDTGAANAYVVGRTPVITSYSNGMPVLFKAIHTNTGASTINAGPSTVPLKRSDGANTLAGDIVTGQVYHAIYDAATTSFLLVNLVPSQVAQGGSSSWIVSSANTGGPTVSGSSGVLTHGGGTDSATDIYFTAQQACTIQLSANIAASGHDDAAPGGGHGGFLLSFLKGATTLAKALVWTANDGVGTTNDYNVSQNVINTSGGSVGGNLGMPATVITLAQGDILHIQMNATYSWAAWLLDYWKFLINIVVL